MLNVVLAVLCAAAHANNPKVPKPMAPLPRLEATAVQAVKIAPAADQTAQLKSLQYAVRRGEAGMLPEEIRLHRFLFAPGFSWDSVPNYFEPNIGRLKKLGLDAELVATDPLGTNTDNGRMIAEAIKKDPRPVVLIGHSKGGLDSIVGLQNDPVARAQVTKLVTIQTPYGGTAVADWFEARPWLVATSLAYLRLLNPFNFWKVNPFFRHRTIEELTTRFRAEASKLPPFPDGGPDVFTIGSRVTAETAIRLALWMSAGTAKSLSGKDNDGIVAPEETEIPASTKATLEHVGHMDTISDPSSWKYKRLGVRGHYPTFAADLTEAIVRWIFAPKARR